MNNIALPFDAESQAWVHAAGRGIDWLRTRLADDGRLFDFPADLGAVYKWPLALAVAGHAQLGRRMLEALVADFQTDGGDLRTGADKSSDPLYGQIADTYTNTWPLVAARVFEFEDLGSTGLDELRRRHVPATGGYLTGTPGQHADQRQDIVTIAGCGNALLAWGCDDEAAGAGDCLLQVLEAQGPADAVFHLYIGSDGSLLRGDLGIPETLARIDPALPGQVYVYWGMSAVFLARLYAVTGEARFLDGAQAYFARHDACSEDHIFDGLGCCKTGWAAAALYRITGEAAYRRIVERAGAELVRLQTSSGDWSRPGLSAVLNCDCTAELVYHLTQYTVELAGGP